MFEALGVGRSGLKLPENLIPGGDCPAPGPAAQEEIASQASALVPLKEGLTLAEVWQPNAGEDYECLTQIKKIATEAIDTTIDCNYAKRPGPLHRRICRSDLRTARMLHTAYGALTIVDASGEQVPETIIGATGFSLSTDQYAELKRTGATQHHYVELRSVDQLQRESRSVLRLEGVDKIQLAVNATTVDVPILRVSGDSNRWWAGRRLKGRITAMVVDDPRFPLLVDYVDSSEEDEASRFRLQFVKISFPGDAERELAEKRRLVAYGIYFDFNSDRIRRESEPVLKELADALSSHPDWRLSINGHTDNIGGDAYNQDLSQRRSEAVRRALVERYKIAADRLSAVGHGASVPQDTNDTPEGRAKNRRVELIREEKE